LAPERGFLRRIATRSDAGGEYGRSFLSDHYRVFIALFVALSLLVGSFIYYEAKTQSAAASHGQNVLVIMTDDETYAELQYMPQVKSLLVGQGTSFDNFYTTTPNCCPSRAAYYTGQVPHNDGIIDNVPPLGGAQKFQPHLDQTLGSWMQGAGYYTASVGKFLNGWGNPDKPDFWTGGITPPPGWNNWFGLIDPTTYSYYDYDVSVNGERRHYGTAPEDYQTNVLGKEVQQSITNGTKSGKPWYVSWTPLAPHTGQGESTNINGTPSNIVAVPPPDHLGQFKNERLYTVPSQSYGIASAQTADVLGKPKYVQDRVRKLPVTKAGEGNAWRAELETIQGVDDWVGRIYKTLQDLGELNNTTIIFTSDNGLFHGEHGLRQKGLLYDEAVHVPLVIRGPGFPAASTAHQMAEMTDLAPTILGLGHAQTTQPLDGIDLKPLASDSTAAADRALLLETAYSYTKLATKEIRVANWAFMAWSDGSMELYDMAKDPYQMKNLAADPAYAAVRLDLGSRLSALATCAGPNCQMYVHKLP